jgi:site-specific DNA recombinase
LRAADDGLSNLHGAIEKGIVALDSSLQSRVNHLRDQREKILAEMALVKRDKPSPRKVSSMQVAYACEHLRALLLDPEQGYRKQLLAHLVSEIRVGTETVTLTGSTAALNEAITEMEKGTSAEVPRFVSEWLARSDSNALPSGS